MRRDFGTSFLGGVLTYLYEIVPGKGTGNTFAVVVLVFFSFSVLIVTYITVYEYRYGTSTGIYSYAVYRYDTGTLQVEYARQYGW